MNFIKKFVVYLLLLVFDVKTVVNDTENLDKCLQRIDETLTQSKESHRNLLKLIDQSTVILKAFCSENLIKSVEECDDIDDDDDAGLSENNGMLNDDDYNDYYFYKSDDERNLKILMTFTPTTVYKGTNLLRQLESFNNQEYYRIKGWVEFAEINFDVTSKISRDCDESLWEFIKLIFRFFDTFGMRDEAMIMDRRLDRLTERKEKKCHWNDFREDSCDGKRETSRDHFCLLSALYFLVKLDDEPYDWWNETNSRLGILIQRECCEQTQHENDNVCWMRWKGYLCRLCWYKNCFALWGSNLQLKQILL